MALVSAGKRMATVKAVEPIQALEDPRRRVPIVPPRAPRGRTLHAPSGRGSTPRGRTADRCVDGELTGTGCQRSATFGRSALPERSVGWGCERDEELTRPSKAPSSASKRTTRAGFWSNFSKRPFGFRGRSGWPVSRVATDHDAADVPADPITPAVAGTFHLRIAARGPLRAPGCRLRPVRVVRRRHPGTGRAPGIRLRRTPGIRSRRAAAGLPVLPSGRPSAIVWSSAVRPSPGVASPDFAPLPWCIRHDALYGNVRGSAPGGPMGRRG